MITLFLSTFRIPISAFYFLLSAFPLPPSLRLRSTVHGLPPSAFPLALILAMCVSAVAQPVITTQPQNQTNLVGTTVTLTAAAIGVEPLAYQWQQAFDLFNYADRPDGTNHTLAITNVQIMDSGNYRLIVTNMEGSVTSSVARLEVLSLPTLQFSSSSYSVPESAVSISLPVRRTGWLEPAVEVNYATADLSATNGVNYSAVSGTLSFAPGETNKAITVPILNDGFVRGTKVFLVRLSNPTDGSVLGAKSISTVSITDNDVGIQFKLASYSVAEDAGTVVVEVSRGDDGTLPVTVGFRTGNQAAISGVDYVGVTNTLAFASQERLRLVPVAILNNDLKQANRAFGLVLESPAGAMLGSLRTSTVTITDNDQGFQFQTNAYSVLEDAGAALVGVLRGTDQTSSSVTVDYASRDISARTGTDYLGVTNTLLFGPGEKLKFVAIPLLNNGVKQGSRSFQISLSNPAAGSVLGAPVATTVSVLDNDPGLGFEQTQYSNSWDSAAVQVTVLRGNDQALGPITVNYTTTDGTARAGVDYQAISGTLQFQENDSIRSLMVPLLVKRATQGAKFFRIVLSNPSGGAALATTTTTVYLRGAYSIVAPQYDTSLAIQQVGGLGFLTWAGGGQMQRADQPAGPWQMVPSARSPTAVHPPMPANYYRVTRPRPVKVYVPSTYDGHTPMPLVILLHGYSSTGVDHEGYMRFEPLAEARGFFYCYPDGIKDRAGYQSWNATDSCCDFFSAAVDDAEFLRGLIEETASQLAVDKKRIYLVGHSNGGYMSYRMACQHADLIAGIASLAGMTFLDPGRFQPSQPVNILQIHGTADDVVFYWGGALSSPPFSGNMSAYPGAPATVQLWAAYNGASGPSVDAAPSLDLTTDVAGLDTVVTRYTNAPPGGAAELWTIVGGNHGPTLSSQFSSRVIDWLLSHPKP